MKITGIAGLREAQQLLCALIDLRGAYTDNTEKFRYALDKNLDYLESHEKKYQKLLDEINHIPGRKEYENERIALLIDKHAQKDANGAPVIQKNPQTGQDIYVLNDPAAWKADFDALREKHKAYADAELKYFESVKSFEEGEFEIEFYTITPDRIPTNCSLRDEQIISHYMLGEGSAIRIVKSFQGVTARK